MSRARAKHGPAAERLKIDLDPGEGLDRLLRKGQPPTKAKPKPKRATKRRK